MSGLCWCEQGVQSLSLGRGCLRLERCWFSIRSGGGAPSIIPRVRSHSPAALSAVAVLAPERHRLVKKLWWLVRMAPQHHFSSDLEYCILFVFLQVLSQHQSKDDAATVGSWLLNISNDHSCVSSKLSVPLLDGLLMDRWICSHCQ